MKTISDAQLFELFLKTLDCCGMFLLKCDSQDIDYYLFEEFDSDSTSFLHEKSLNRLLASRCISVEVSFLCHSLYEKFRRMEGTDLWNSDAVKTNPEWHTILSLADEIRRSIRNNK